MSSSGGLVGAIAPLFAYKKTLTAAALATALVAHIRGRQHRRSLKTLRRPLKAAKARGKHSGKIDFEFVKRLHYVLSSAFPFLSRESLTALCLASALIGRTFMTLVIAGNMGRSLKYLTARDWESLWRNMGQFIIITVPTAMLNASLRFFTGELELNIREKITKRVHTLYMQRMNYYWANKVGKQKLENADQLIAEDVQKFSQTLAEVYSQVLKPIVDLIIFSFQLHSSLGYRGPLGLYGYFAFSAFVLSAVLPSYGRMAVRKQELEGQYRASHSRIIENGEMVAFMGGEIPEKSLLDSAFMEIRNYTSWTLGRAFFSYGLMSFINKYMANIQGLGLIMLPILFNENGKGEMTPSETVNYYVYTRQLLEGITDAVVRLFEVQKHVGTLAGLTSRVYNLMHALAIPEELDLPHDPT
eukprot:TRINITY_DN1357_c0_g2_i3.p1 TRINITY_DN1357_c0_g2~~TRINITY_DN1357_c0_g2_i3.p1  ORF type:complete len:415 (+),score=93.33 TRINITY_DN1357_c0_g2_i3:84-1328(+)